MSSYDEILLGIPYLVVCSSNNYQYILEAYDFKAVKRSSFCNIRWKWIR